MSSTLQLLQQLPPQRREAVQQLVCPSSCFMVSWHCPHRATRGFYVLLEVKWGTCRIPMQCAPEVLQALVSLAVTHALNRLR